MAVEEYLKNLNRPPAQRSVPYARPVHRGDFNSGTLSPASINRNMPIGCQNRNEREIYPRSLSNAQLQPAYKNNQSEYNIDKYSFISEGSSITSSSIKNIQDTKCGYFTTNHLSHTTATGLTSQGISTYEQVPRNTILENSYALPRRNGFKFVFGPDDPRDPYLASGSSPSLQPNLQYAYQVQSVEASSATLDTNLIEPALPSFRRQDILDLIDSIFSSDPVLLELWLSTSMVLSYIPEPMLTFLRSSAPNATTNILTPEDQQLNIIPQQAHIGIINPTNTVSQLTATRNFSFDNAPPDWTADSSLMVTPSHHRKDYSMTDTQPTEADIIIRNNESLPTTSTIAEPAEKMETVTQASAENEDFDSYDDESTTQSDGSVEPATTGMSRVSEVMETAHDMELPSKLISQKGRFPGDLYRPILLKVSGTRREGRCEICHESKYPRQWFDMRTSEHLYHKLAAHGVASTTGRKYPEPAHTYTLGNGTRNGYCFKCRKFVPAYSTRSRLPTSSPWAPWYRHQYAKHPEPRVSRRR